MVGDSRKSWVIVSRLLVRFEDLECIILFKQYMNFGTASISQNFLFQLHRSYDQGILELGTGKVVKDGINGYCESAISVYPLSVATWEAFFHETILSPINLIVNNSSKINSIPIDIIDKWDIITKTVVVLDLLYDKTFEKGSQPFQDFILLVSIRNSLVHFKLNIPNTKIINAIQHLSQRNIFMPHSNIKKNPSEENIIDIWPHMISTTEGIRWAINTITNMAYKLADFIPKDKQNLVISHISNFKIISTEMAICNFNKLGVDSNSKIGIIKI
jgi:hypothetical protein